MNCEDFRASYLAGLQQGEDLRHLEECASCRARLASLEAGRTSLADPAIWEEPPPELAEQVSSLIAGSAWVTDPGIGTAQRPRWSRWVWPVAGVAAAVVVAVVTMAALRSTAPDWEVAVPGTDLAPAASATVRGWNTEAGTRMVMRVTGLDPAPDGYVYEFWLSEGPIHTSAGTFRAGTEIVMWTGASRADFPRLWITLEPLDEDESPSGQTVLDTGV